MVSGGIGMDRWIGREVMSLNPDVTLNIWPSVFFSNGWEENAELFSGLVSLGLECEPPKIAAVLGSCEAIWKRKNH